MDYIIGGGYRSNRIHQLNLNTKQLKLTRNVYQKGKWVRKDQKRFCDVTAQPLSERKNTKQDLGNIKQQPDDL